MRKPLELRQHLQAALPKLQQDPDNLKMFVDRGRILTSGTDKLAWMYAYTLQLHFLDFVDHPDTVIAPLLIWLRQHQFDVVDNKDKKGIRFSTEYLDANTMDLMVEIDLTERVISQPHPSKPGAVQLEHCIDTPPLHMPMRERWEIYIREEKVAEWDYLPSGRTPGA